MAKRKQEKPKETEEERRNRLLLSKLERKTGLFNYWFPKGRVTVYALQQFNYPISKLFLMLMPGQVDQARKEGARFAAKRFLQHPGPDAGPLHAWRWDRCYPYAMQKYRKLVDPNCWSSKARYDSEARRYHGHMIAYFVRVFNAKNRKPKAPKAVP